MNWAVKKLKRKNYSLSVEKYYFHLWNLVKALYSFKIQRSNFKHNPGDKHIRISLKGYLIKIKYRKSDVWLNSQLEKALIRIILFYLERLKLNLWKDYHSFILIVFYIQTQYNMYNTNITFISFRHHKALCFLTAIIKRLIFILQYISKLNKEIWF